VSILAGIGGKLLVGLAIAGAVAAVVFGLIGKGRGIEKAEQIQRNSEIRRKQDAVKKSDPTDVDDILGRL
jgi:hypothetical protein